MQEVRRVCAARIEYRRSEPAVHNALLDRDHRRNGGDILNDALDIKRLDGVHVANAHLDSI